MNKKSRRLALMLSMAMALGTVSGAYAEKANDKIAELQKQNYVQGYEDGQLKLEKFITRAEMAKLLVLANDGEKAAKELQNKKGIFKDIAPNHWANGYINAANEIAFNVNGLKMINGYPDGSFKASNNIKPGELAKMLLVTSDDKLTEKDIENANKNWPSGWINKAKEEGIFDKNAVIDENAEVDREMAFNSFYNALEKTGKVQKDKSEENKEDKKDTNSSEKTKESVDTSIVKEDSKKEKAKKENPKKEEPKKENSTKDQNDIIKAEYEKAVKAEQEKLVKSAEDYKKVVSKYYDDKETKAEQAKSEISDIKLKLQKEKIEDSKVKYIEEKAAKYKELTKEEQNII